MWLGDEAENVFEGSSRYELPLSLLQLLDLAQCIRRIGRIDSLD
jgi:hypothetical protein